MLFANFLKIFFFFFHSLFKLLVLFNLLQSL